MHAWANTYGECTCAVCRCGVCVCMCEDVKACICCDEVGCCYSVKYLYTGSDNTW